MMAHRPPSSSHHSPSDLGADNSGRPRLYGRAKGRPLRKQQQALMKNFYPQIKIPPNPMSTIRPETELWFEIGFGGSEHLIWQARNNPDRLIWGAEPFVNGVAKAVSAISAEGLENIRLYQGDGRDILEALEAQSLSRLFVLFPDPWPKARHHKRRLITEEFLIQVYETLRPGGEFRFASDIIDYVDWTLSRIRHHGGFSWSRHKFEDWRMRDDDWPPTRYEHKAIKAGRACHYFKFVRQ